MWLLVPLRCWRKVSQGHGAGAGRGLAQLRRISWMNLGSCADISLSLVYVRGSPWVIETLGSLRPRGHSWGVHVLPWPHPLLQPPWGLPSYEEHSPPLHWVVLALPGQQPVLILFLTWLVPSLSARYLANKLIQNCSRAGAWLKW
jgi:hypothetical protein